MDYILIKGAEGIGYVLHKKCVKILIQQRKKAILGTISANIALSGMLKILPQVK
ncbi:hypothetical protein M0J18_RS16000 [Morganella morganii]|nr:hypothetical protein [Morganella morganii]